MAVMPQPGDAFGRYQITGRIGRGGMGVVFSARQVDLNREVALKLLSPDLADSEEYRNRFIREAAVLAQLESAHVISVHDAGEQDGWLYIATQLIPDGDLAQRLSSVGPLSPMLALELLAQSAAGLADAHDLGIIHRDLKPSNILLRDRSNGEITAYICDLGIARTEGSEHTRTTGVIGTLGYMAPERHQGLPATTSSDIYALGCLLWAMLTGSAPYVGTDLAVALGHLQEPIPQLELSTPGALVINPLLHAAMAKDPADRFSSARVLRNAVDAATKSLAGQPGAQSPAFAPTVYRQAGFSPTPTPTPIPYPQPQTQQRPMAQQPMAHFEPLGRARPPTPGSGGRAVLIVLLVLLLLGGAGVGGWALWHKAKQDETAPVAAAINQLRGSKFSYQLGETSADCAAKKVIDQSGSNVDSKKLASTITAAWPDLDPDQAELIAGAVISCSPDVYDKLVTDVLDHDANLDASCTRRELTESEMRELLKLELTGSGSSVEPALQDLLQTCSST